MSYNKMTREEQSAVNALPAHLKETADAIAYEADNGGSFHDAAVDMLERGDFRDITQDELKITLTAMGSHWDAQDGLDCYFKTI